MKTKIILVALIILSQLSGCSKKIYDATYPKSDYIETVEFDLDTLIELAPGSDNWVVTWASDDHQYTSWGDGGGFGGNNELGRSSMGVARIEGDPNNFKAINIWGGHQGQADSKLGGGTYGIIAIDGNMWFWLSGDESSGNSSFDTQRLYLSQDKGLNWQPTDVIYRRSGFKGPSSFYSPTFLQFGPGYQGARDDYVYSYAPEARNDIWEVQFPGDISLLRVKKDQMADPLAYQYFAGIDDNQQPLWTASQAQRKPVFSENRGVMRTSVTYVNGLQRYILITQMISRFKDKDGHIGMFEAPEPWGPWRQVLFENAWDIKLQQRGEKSVYYNISNKWTSDDGINFSLIYTGASQDNFGTLRGKFVLYKGGEKTE